MTSVWDNPEMQVTDSFFSWKDKPVGTNITGLIKSVGIHRWDDGSVCPQFVLDVNGEEVGLTVSQVGLKKIMAEQRPEAGDHISVTLKGIENRPGGKTLKQYEVVTTRAGAAPVAAPAPVAATPAQAAQHTAAAAPAADPLAGFTPEQLAAIAALQAQK